MENELKKLEEKGYKNLNKEEIKRYSFLKHKERRDKYKSNLNCKEIIKYFMACLLFIPLIYLIWFLLHLIPAVPLSPFILYDFIKNPSIWKDVPIYSKSVIFVALITFIFLIGMAIFDLFKKIKK